MGLEFAWAGGKCNDMRPKILGDEQVRQIHLLLHLDQKIDRLGQNGDVQGRDRLKSPAA